MSYLANIVQAFGGGNQDNMPNPKNLAAMQYIKMQSDEEQRDYQEDNSRDEVFAGSNVVDTFREIKRLRLLELNNPKEKAGITDDYITKNTQFNNIEEFQRWGSAMVSSTSGSGGQFQGGPGYNVLFNQGNLYLEEANTAQAKQILGINPNNTITGIKAVYDDVTEQMKYSFTVRNPQGTEAFATVGGAPIVDLAKEGGIPKVEENIIRVDASTFNSAINKGVMSVQEGLSPEALLASPPQFRITSDGTELDVASLDPTLDKISPDGDVQSEVQPGTSTTTTERVDISGDGDFVDVEKVLPTSYAVPGIGMVDFKPSAAGGKYQDVAPLFKDDGTMVVVNPNGTRKDRTPTANEYVPVPADIKEEYLPARMKNKIAAGEQLYLSPTPDQNGYYSFYDSKGRQVGRGSVGGIGMRGEERDYVEKLVTGFDSEIALTSTVNEVVGRPNISEVTNNFNPQLRTDLESALNNKNWDEAVRLIDQGVGENLLDSDDQVALVSLIQKSRGNLYTLDFDKKTAIAAASMSAIPRAERTAALAKQFAYFMETGKLDFNTRGLNQQAQNIQISKENQFMSQLKDATTAVAGVSNEAAKTKEGEDILDAQLTMLKIIEDRVLADGSDVSKRQYYKTRGLAASKKLAAKAEDDRWAAGLRAWIFNRDTDPTIAPGQLMPNIVALDKDKNYTTDPRKVQFVQFIRQGSTGRISGEPVSLYGSTTEFSSDDLELFKDVAIANTQMKGLVQE